MTTKKKLITSSVVLVGIALGTGSVVIANSLLLGGQPNLFYDSGNRAIGEFSSPNFEINARGETFGSAAGIYCVEYMPDLTRVLGDNGIVGYARTSELPVSDPVPSSPEEAVRMMEEAERDGVAPRVINVYENDGITIIDTFTIGGMDVNLYEYE
jgi:hypothetical protein